MILNLLSVVGARPNFMKIAAIYEAINEFNQASDGNIIRHTLVHTGQHYDANMSDSFFNDLDLPKPNIFLGVGSGSHSVQTAKIMEKFESIVIGERPNIVLVVGDVNSTVACALVTKKTICPASAGEYEFTPRLAHVEAGLRSFDRSMPEEINRIVTDSISDYLFTTEESANQNLLHEGIAPDRIYFVGNSMIDTLIRQRGRAQDSEILNDLQLCDGSNAKAYALLTLHRPSNVDNPKVFSRMLDAFLELSKSMPIIFPVHPRTLKCIQEADLGDYFVDHALDGPDRWDSRVRIRIVPPLGYLDFLCLMSKARVVFTDSGGVQEETTILGVPCITLRVNTERPATIHDGTNVLVGSDPSLILQAFRRVVNEKPNSRRTPLYWDGHAAKRIIQILVQEYSKQLTGTSSAWQPSLGLKELN